VPPKQTTVLRALDPHFAGWGFHRAKRSFEWFRQPRPDVVHGVHLNCAAYESTGRVDIIPTLEVGLESVERALAEFAEKPRGTYSCSFGCQLHTLLHAEYVATTQDGPMPTVARLAADIGRHGLSTLDRLSSLEGVSDLLASSSPRDWPTLLGRSSRARLLPLVLALRGRTAEAHDWLHRLREDLQGRDQLTPDIETFARWFQERFGQVA